MTGPVLPISSEEASRITSRMAAISVGVALFLTALKAWSAWHSGSVGMLASLADSALDLVGSGIAFMAVRYAAAPPDREHRFGHGKAEAFAGLIQSGLIGLSCIAVAVEAVRHVLDPHPIRQGAEALGVLAIASLATIALVMAQSRAIARTGSVATKGDRMHYASDLVANGAVMIGIAGGAFFALPWVDAVTGFVVAAWLAWGAWRVAGEAADHLLDRELPDAERARIRALAMQDGAITNVHALRTRASGSYIHIQFHADIAPNVTLVGAHEIMVAAEDRIRTEFPTADVLIHPDPRGAAEPHGHADFEEGRRVDAG